MDSEKFFVAVESTPVGALVDAAFIDRVLALMEIHFGREDNAARMYSGAEMADLMGDIRAGIARTIAGLSS